MSHNLSSEKGIQLINCGQQDCKDLHRWGPGIRPCYIIHYVIQGAGYLKMNGKTHRIEAGESFLTYPNTVIEYYPDEKTPWEYTWVDFMGEEVEEYLQRTRFGRKQPVCNVKLKEKLLPLFQAVQGLDLYVKNSGEADGILMTILGIYTDLYPAVIKNSRLKEDNRLSTALMLIASNYHKQSFHIDSLCQMMNINRVTLYRLFQGEFEESPSRYLLKYRLNQSKWMLEQGLAVKTVSISSGFSDPFYYSKMFKKYVGCSPSEYV